eukprot:476902-Rhodomonas_salina.4
MSVWSVCSLHHRGGRRRLRAHEVEEVVDDAALAVLGRGDRERFVAAHRWLRLWHPDLGPATAFVSSRSIDC